MKSETRFQKVSGVEPISSSDLLSDTSQKRISFLFNDLRTNPRELYHPRPPDQISSTKYGQLSERSLRGLLYPSSCTRLFARTETSIGTNDTMGHVDLSPLSLRVRRKISLGRFDQDCGSYQTWAGFLIAINYIGASVAGLFAAVLFQGEASLIRAYGIEQPSLENNVYQYAYGAWEWLQLSYLVSGSTALLEIYLGAAWSWFVASPLHNGNDSKHTFDVTRRKWLRALPESAFLPYGLVQIGFAIGDLLIGFGVMTLREQLFGADAFDSDASFTCFHPDGKTMQFHSPSEWAIEAGWPGFERFYRERLTRSRVPLMLIFVGTLCRCAGILAAVFTWSGLNVLYVLPFARCYTEMYAEPDIERNKDESEMMSSALEGLDQSWELIIAQLHIIDNQTSTLLNAHLKNTKEAFLLREVDPRATQPAREQIRKALETIVSAMALFLNKLPLSPLQRQELRLVGMDDRNQTQLRWSSRDEQLWDTFMSGVRDLYRSAIELNEEWGRLEQEVDAATSAAVGLVNVETLRGVVGPLENHATTVSAQLREHMTLLVNQIPDYLLVGMQYKGPKQIQGSNYTRTGLACCGREVCQGACGWIASLSHNYWGALRNWINVHALLLVFWCLTVATSGRWDESPLGGLFSDQHLSVTWPVYVPSWEEQHGLDPRPFIIARFDHKSSPPPPSSPSIEQMQPPPFVPHPLPPPYPAPPPSPASPNLPPYFRYFPPINCLEHQPTFPLDHTVLNAYPEGLSRDNDASAFMITAASLLIAAEIFRFVGTLAQSVGYLRNESSTSGSHVRTRNDTGRVYPWIKLFCP